MFTQKHYIAIAKALREIDSSFFDHDTLNKVVESLCELFKKDNEKFNKARFIKAIGE